MMILILERRISGMRGFEDREMTQVGRFQTAPCCINREVLKLLYHDNAEKHTYFYRLKHRK
ncbi:hypothetical protein MA16_Dca007685 [Dendrobium catenatum]|uniref:Uncharacterized protein n=1 Tax=Dendrobium catenatum TaxID=906689 RepID=A0A2I0X0X8_9ASPA|nr:hypothetical protein MA16_Dca007685 [Dendrobium catenatum]